MDQTIEAWQTLESYVPQKIRHLGISNTTLPILERIWHLVEVKPAVVQNRFYVDTKFDLQLRSYCEEKSVVFQAFWTLTANPTFLRSRVVTELARKMGLSSAQAWYCLIVGLDNTVILNGTTNPLHMREDLEAIERGRQWATAHSDAFKHHLQDFKNVIAAP